MAVGAHKDIPDTTDELAQRQAKMNARALARGEQPKTAAPIKMQFDAPRRLNGLVDRHRYGCNVLLRLYRGTANAQGEALNNGWRDGNFGRGFQLAPGVVFTPVSVKDALDLYNALRNGIYACYLWELFDNVQAVGTDADKYKIYQHDSEGNRIQINGHDYSVRDEADEIWNRYKLPKTEFLSWFASLSKPVQQGR